MRTRGGLGWWLTVIVIGVLGTGGGPVSVLAEAPRAPGSDTGDGSTPFTGLARAPEANMFVGAATTAVELQVPPGRHNLTPRLALSYSSSAGPGPYGTGWDLPLPRVQRSTKNGVPHCGVLAGQRDYVLTLPGNAAECALDLATGVCTVAIQEGFVQITYDGGANTWTVRDRGGLKYIFGEVSGHRIGSAVAARFVAPCGGTFAWGVSRIVDPHGNQIEFDYDVEENVLYPRWVRYGGNPGAALPALFEVAFNWRWRAAGDVVLGGNGGFLARVQRRLDSVDVRQLTDGRAVRSYGFTYERLQDGRPTGDERFLSAVTLFDGQGRSLARADGLPASGTFLYQDGTLGVGFAAGAQRASRPPHGYEATALRWTTQQGGGGWADEVTHRDAFDIDGDAIPDLVRDNFPFLDGPCAWSVHRGGPEGFAAEPIEWEVPEALCYIGIRHAAIYGQARYGQIETVDLDGDGIVDLVDARSVPWTLYRGRRPSATTPGGFTAGVSWPAPRAALRAGGSTVEGFSAGIRGMVDTLDLIDLNGDGRLDLVQAERDDERPPFDWQVWYNTGSGFEAAPQLFNAGASGGLRFVREDSGVQIAGIYDMTGDGLPDRIVMVNTPANSWWVYVNQGHSFAPRELWSFPHLGCNWSGLRVPAGLSDPSVVRELVDINGDGLPDIVDICGWSAERPVWQVVLNRGAGFATTPITWAAPYGHVRDIDSFPDQVTHRDLFDADGDGLVDFVDYTTAATTMAVHRHGSGAWCASGDGLQCDPSGGDRSAPNPYAGRPGVLRVFEDGIGGTTTLDYRPSTDWDNRDLDGVPSLPFVLWTVVEIARSDGLCADDCDDPPAAHEMRTQLTYWNGRFDPGARELRGFRVVERDDGGGAVHSSWFHQDGARKGKVELAQTATPTGTVLGFTYDSWACVALPSMSSVTCPAVTTGAAHAVRLMHSVRAESSNGVVNRFTYLRNHEWDAYGNVTRSRRYGGGATPLETTTAFAVDVAGGTVLDRPRRTTVRDNAGVVVAEKWYAYDHRAPGAVTAGLATTAWEWLDQVSVAGLPEGESCPEAPASGSGRCVTTRMAYDALGNLTRLVDAAGQITETEYDAATHLYAATVTTPLGHRITSGYDPGCGTKLWQTVAYDPAVHTAASAARTAFAYDEFCRLVATTAPGESSAVPDVRLQYRLGAPGTPSRVSRGRLGPYSRSALIWHDEFFDAFGRRIQVQRDAVVDGQRRVVVEATTQFDAVGNPVRQYAPSILGAGSPVGEYRPAAATEPATETAYDALGRVVGVAQPDGAVVTHDRGTAWETTTRDACVNAGTCRGATTRERRDGFGRVLEVQVSEGDRVLQSTRRGYDALGRLRTLTQDSEGGAWNPATTIDIAYDSLGRKIRVADPDSGTWRYGYDLVGNLIYEDDPTSGQHRQFCYDAGGRLVKKVVIGTGDSFDASACTGPATATYRYDDGSGCPTKDCARGGCAVGRLTQVEEADGGGVRFCYDARGRKAQAEVTIVAAGESQRAVMRYAYDRAGRVTQLTYPDGERLKYYYDAAGGLRRMRGRTSYVRSLTYDVFGRPRVLVRGNRATDTFLYHGADDGFRLARHTVTGDSGATVLDYAYEAYLPTGKLTHLVDWTGGAQVLDNSATMAYDALGRVTGVAGPNLPYGSGYEYDRLGNMTVKDGEPLQYETAHPHRLARSASGTAAHDANGNRVVAGGHVFAYDAENRLVGVDGGAVSYGYDHAGRRTVSVRDGEVRRYFGRLVETSGGTMTKYYYAGGMLVASQQVSLPYGAMTGTGRLVRVAAAGGGRSGVALLLGDEASWVALGLCGLGIVGLIAVPGARRRRVVGLAVRRGHVIAAVALVCVATTPIHVRPAVALGVRTISYHHVDHLGSTQSITDVRGRTTAHIRYLPYGGVRGRFDGYGVARGGDCRSLPSCREFTGYETEPLTGLQYAGARFYDPGVGSFLTHDPARQFASPYTYGNGDPLNWTDPDGEFFEILAAVVIASVLSAAVRAVIAAASGASLAEIGKAAAAGAISGAVGVGLGVVVAGTSIGLSSLSGSLPSNVGVGDVIQALGDVALRSAAATVTADTLGGAAEAAGAPQWASMLVSFVGGYAGTYGYDQYLTGPLGSAAGGAGLTKVSSKSVHQSVTARAASDAGYTPFQVEEIVAANLQEDADVWWNEGHFADGAHAEFYRLASEASRLWGSSPNRDFLVSLGGASHYLQDPYALGHLFPGTQHLKGPAGAPFRFLVHQTVGGEVTLLGAQFEANRRFFRALPAVLAI
ncbi:hypothetical protein L6Q96_13610 [Candidatus Binatia bacterium]|nr:hypothetical protein [Candidatus Binatia bacterium]